MPSDPLLKIDDDVGQISAIAVQAEVTLGSAITPVPILVGAREILGDGRRRQTKLRAAAAITPRYYLLINSMPTA